MTKRNPPPKQQPPAAKPDERLLNMADPIDALDLLALVIYNENNTVRGDYIPLVGAAFHTLAAAIAPPTPPKE